MRRATACNQGDRGCAFGANAQTTRCNHASFAVVLRRPHLDQLPKTLCEPIANVPAGNIRRVMSTFRGRSTTTLNLVGMLRMPDTGDSRTRLERLKIQPIPALKPAANTQDFKVALVRWLDAHIRAHLGGRHHASNRSDISLHSNSAARSPPARKRLARAISLAASRRMIVVRPLQVRSASSTAGWLPESF